MKKIKVIFFIDSFRIGGMHKQVLYLAKHLNRLNFEPIVCTSSDKGGLKKEYESADCKLICLGWRHRLDFRVLIRLIKVLYREKPDIFFITEAQNLFYYRIAKLFYYPKIKQIGSFRAFSFWFSHDKLSYKFFDNLFSKWLYHTSENVTVNSNALKLHYSKVLGLKQNSKPLEVIYNGCDFIFKIDKSPSEVRRSLNILEDEILIIMLARLDPWKDFETLFQAVKKISIVRSGFKLVLVGDGELKKQLIEHVEKLQISNYVIFTGEVKNPANLLNASDISILSTHGEGFSNTILESMAFGKPLIATNVGGNPEAIGIDSSSGLLFPLKSSEVLTNHLLMLMDEREKRISIGVSAKNRIHELCSLKKYITAYENLFLNVME